MEHGGVSVRGVDIVDAVLSIDALLHRPEQGAVVVGVDAKMVMEEMVNEFVNDGMESLNDRFDGIHLDGYGSFLPGNSARLAVEDDVSAKAGVLFPFMGPKSASRDAFSGKPLDP